MLGQYTAYPILKGWEYRLYTGTRTVKRGETIEIIRVSETGLMMAIVVATTDAYGTVVVEGQGAELRTESIEAFPEDYFVFGSLHPDPVGYITRYFRPDPASTAGLYTFVVGSGYWGSPLPFVPTVVCKLRLREESTQSQADVSFVGRGINVVDKKAYIHSIRRLLDPNSELTIDPAFMAVGPAEFRKETLK